MTLELKIDPIVNGGGAIALWKVLWGFGEIHFGALFGVCGRASTNHSFKTTFMHHINSKLPTSVA